MAHAGAGELTAGAFGFGERGLLRAADEHERRELWVAERADAGGVELRLILQAGQRTQAGDPGGVCIDEAGPCGRQREQPQRVTGRRGVEDDVVIASGRFGVTKQRGEGVKRGDLDRARARQAFLHARERRVGEQPAVRADGTLAVFPCRGLGVDVRRVETGDPGHRSRSLGELGTEDLVEVGGRIGRYDQHPLTASNQRHGGRARERGLAHAALTGEEQNAGGLLYQCGQGAHQQPPPPQQPPAPDAGAAIVSDSRRRGSVTPAQPASSLRTG